MKLAAVMVFLFPLTWCAVLDVCYAEIPDVNHIPVLFGGLLLAGTMKPLTALISLCAGGVFFGVAYLTKKLWKKSLGGADVKVMTLIIICSGIVSSLSIFAAAFALAGVISLVLKGVSYIRLKLLKKSRPVLERYGGGIPFVPFLLTAVCLYYTYPA